MNETTEAEIMSTAHTNPNNTGSMTTELDHGLNTTTAELTTKAELNVTEALERQDDPPSSTSNTKTAPFLFAFLLVVATIAS